MRIIESTMKECFKVLSCLLGKVFVRVGLLSRETGTEKVVQCGSKDFVLRLRESHKLSHRFLLCVLLFDPSAVVLLQRENRSFDADRKNATSKGNKGKKERKKGRGKTNVSNHVFEL